jgi:phospholipase C
MRYSCTLLAQLGLLGAVQAAPRHDPQLGSRSSELPWVPFAPPLPPPPVTLPSRFPPLPGPQNPPPSVLDHSVEAALTALGRSPASLRQPGTVPYPNAPRGVDTLPGIKHIIYLMMENHSYDNMCGMLTRPDADGFELDRHGTPVGTQPGVNGTTQHWFESTSVCQTGDMVSQEWTDSHNQWNNGSMDGAVVSPFTHTTADASGAFSMSYFTKKVLPFWFALMELVPIADRWYCSTLCQTWPNREFSLAGTSRGVTQTGQNLTGIEWPQGTIFHLLDKYGIKWVMAWNGTDNTVGNTLQEFNGAITNQSMTEHIVDYGTFFEDTSKGNLPPFTYLDQRGAATTMEPDKNMAVGEDLIYQVIKAVMEGPLWKGSIFILNFDEHGGLSDHAIPPPALAPDDVQPIVNPGEFQYDGFHRMGLRVPALVLSPYGKRNYVSHTLYDHASVLAFMERKWNMEAMTYRDANANIFEDMIDWDAMVRGQPTFPSFEELRLPLPALRVPGNDVLNCSNALLNPPPGSVTGP